MTPPDLLGAVERATGERVLDYRPLDSLASQVFEVTLAETGRAVVKVPHVEDGRLSTPRLLDLVREGTDVPVPDVLAVRETGEPSFLVLEFVEGRHVDDPDDLAPAEVRRFAREFGGVLGDLHELDLPVETFGRIRADDGGDLHTIEGFDSWRPRLADTLAVNLDALEGLRLGDLADPVRDHLDEALPEVPDVTDIALHYHDPKVENVVLAEDLGVAGDHDDGSSRIRSPDDGGSGGRYPDDGVFEAVLDWEALETTHWAYPLAFHEVVFARQQSTVPVDEVLLELHEGYADAREWREVPLGGWFDTYRVAALVLRAASPRWLPDRDDWSGEEARDLRASIEALL